MKKIIVVILLITTAFTNSVLLSQDLSVGFGSGIMLSDIRDNFRSGKWVQNPAPEVSLSVEYSFLKYLSLETGITYSAAYYENRPYYIKDFYNYGYEYQNCISCSMWPSLPPQAVRMDFSFLSVPVQLRLNIPTKPGFFIGAGGYMATVLTHSPAYLRETVMKTKGDDYGYILSAGFHYPAGPNLTFDLTGEYRTGRERFVEYKEYRHGMYGISIGLSYRSKGASKKSTETPDSSVTSQKLTLIYIAGADFSHNKPAAYASKYHFRNGASAGFLFNFRPDPYVSFRTGLIFDRLGYGMKDSSDLFYRYAGDSKKGFFVHSKMDIDYLSVPLLINFYTGSKQRFNIYTGFNFGFRINARVTGAAWESYHDSNDYKILRTDIWDDMDSVINPLDFDWIFGTGYTISFHNNLALEISAMYKRGLVDVFNRDYIYQPESSDVKGKKIVNESLAVHAGLIVPLFKHLAQ
ncbi:MAG: porin family protein [Bacteroidales bacterium]